MRKLIYICLILISLIICSSCSITFKTNNSEKPYEAQLIIELPIKYESITDTQESAIDTSSINDSKIIHIILK